jgi:cation diffusion facilitator family transporter
MHDAEKEKNSAALSSVAAAIFLTTMKLVVGLMSGSLGILAEAAHSGLDLLAALVTFLAVWISGKPADRKHLYGHGKVENLSALFETLLLLVTCVWIIHEAYDRLVVRQVHIDASIWAFAIMGISIVVDMGRSRMLYRVAHKHGSQALEADALHFSTDIWSSTVVLFGLSCVKISDWFPALDFLQRADSVAALGVAIMVVYVSMRMGLRTVEGLLDAAPTGMAENVKKMAESMEEIKDCHAVRVRTSGPQLFIDVHVMLDGNMPLKKVHQVMDQIEERVQQTIPHADVTMHPEPWNGPPEELNNIEQNSVPSDSEKPKSASSLENPPA